MKKYRLSIFFNIVFILFTIFYGYYKRDRIYTRIESFFEKEKKQMKENPVPSDEELAYFNNEPLNAKPDSIVVGSDSTLTFLILGNSLTYTGVPKEEPNKVFRGMASSEKEKDFVHVLLGMIAENHHINIMFSMINIAEFERNFSKHSFSKEMIRNSQYQNPDFLIVQIGENVIFRDSTDIGNYEKEYIKLISSFPHSTVIVTSPFWALPSKEYAATRVAIATNSYLVDLSHLGDGYDMQNFASSARHYDNPAVGNHPGDVGMKRIAECLYATFNAIYSSKK